MTKRIYLANPYGFSKQQKGLLGPIIAELEALGLEVWEPFARNNQLDFAQPGWAYEVGQRDFSDVRNADAIFAIVNGTPPDEGVMVELGMAIALGKPTFLFRDDFRRCTDSEQYPLNLMLFTGLPKARRKPGSGRPVRKVNIIYLMRTVGIEEPGEFGCSGSPVA
jgi:nucleoside 2-deoxyribosyltransferase